MDFSDVSFDMKTPSTNRSKRLVSTLSTDTYTSVIPRNDFDIDHLSGVTEYFRNQTRSHSGANTEDKSQLGTSRVSSCRTQQHFMVDKTDFSVSDDNYDYLLKSPGVSQMEANEKLFKNFKSERMSSKSLPEVLTPISPKPEKPKKQKSKSGVEFAYRLRDGSKQKIKIPSVNTFSKHKDDYLIENIKRKGLHYKIEHLDQLGIDAGINKKDIEWYTSWMKDKVENPKDFGLKVNDSIWGPYPIDQKGVYDLDSPHYEATGYEPYYDHLRILIEPIDLLELPPRSTPSTSYLSVVEPELLNTIAIIKPDAMQYKDVVLRAISQAGFQIIGYRILHLTPEQVSEIYAKFYGSPSFPQLVMSWSQGPCLALSMSALNAIEKWKKITGPDGRIRRNWFYPVSMRKRFGVMGPLSQTVHASDNFKEAIKERRYLFPQDIQEPIIKDNDKVNDYLNTYVNPTLSNGLVEVVQERPNDPVMFLAQWLLLNNPYQPRMPDFIAAAPT